MPAISSIIAGVGLAIGAVGIAIQYKGGQDAAAASQQQEAIRMQQLQLDAARQRRDALRKTLISQGIGVNNAADQGANQTDSSVVGGRDQATSYGNQGISMINQNAANGTSMFAANAAESNARGMMGLGGALGSWGSGLVQNSATISRVGQSFGIWGERA